MAKSLQIVWAGAVLFGFGSGLGTYVHRSSRLPPWLWLPCVSAAACLVSYALFYLSFFNVDIGRIATWICWWTSVVFFVRAALDRSVRQMLLDRDAWVPGLVTVLLAFGYLASLFASDADVSNRFRFALPSDNTLPWLLADGIVRGQYGVGIAPAPIIAEWLSSDRPPLQAAIALATRPMALGEPQRFNQCVATWCQMGWLPATYALGRAMALPRRYLQFVLIALAGSPFFFFNSVFTWPKLLSAWLCVTSLALVIHALREPADSSRFSIPVLAAGLVALGILSHGGVLFSVVALPVLAACWWRRPVSRSRAAMAWSAAAMVGIVVLLWAPWLAYQRLYDPPGNRLLKMHLAGVEAIDARGTWEALRDSYHALTWRAYLDGRAANLRQQWFGTYPLPVESLIDWVQWQQLLHHVPMVGFLGLGYLTLIWRSARGDLPQASLRLTRQLLLYALATMAIWIVLMIEPASAMIHQGSYVMTWLLLFGAAVLVARLSRPVRITVLSLHLLLFATCYFFSTRTTVPAAWRGRTFVEAAFLFVSVIFALRLVPDETAGQAM